MPPQFQNGGGLGANDSMQLVNNLGAATVISGMAAWKSSDFLPNNGDELGAFRINFRSRNADPASVRFLLETSDGWYSTDQTFDQGSSFQAFGASTTALTWSPFSDFGVTLGASSADYNDVQSVGFTYATAGTSTGWNGIVVQGFSVQDVVIPEPSALGLLGLGMGVMMAARRKLRRA